MAFDFPSAPTNGQEYVSGDVTYTWNGYGWAIKDTSGAVTDAPANGLDHWRNDGAWVVGDWNSLDSKPTEFPPSYHLHNSDDVMGLDESLANLTSANTAQDAVIALKADTTYVDSQNAAQDATLAGKANITYVDAQNATQDTAIGLKADRTYVDTQNSAQDAVIAAKEPSIAPGTTAQYWRGDKSWASFPSPGLAEAPVDGWEYVRVNGIWRQQSRTFDLNGVTNLDIFVPAHARFALIDGFVFNPAGIGVRVSFDGVNYPAGASDYQIAGGSHNTGTSGFVTNALTSGSLMSLTVAGDSVALAHSFDAKVLLKRVTTGQLFSSHTYARAYNSAAAMQYRSWWATSNLTLAASGSNLAVNALRLTGVTPMANGSYVTVRWA